MFHVHTLFWHPRILSKFEKWEEEVPKFAPNFQICSKIWRANELLIDQTHGFILLLRTSWITLRMKLSQNNHLCKKRILVLEFHYHHDIRTWLDQNFIWLGPTPPTPPSLPSLPAWTCVGTLLAWQYSVKITNIQVDITFIIPSYGRSLKIKYLWNFEKYLRHIDVLSRYLDSKEIFCTSIGVFEIS